MKLKGQKKLVIISLLVILAIFSPLSLFAVPGGDLAPRPGGDGELSAADLIILKRFIHGEVIPDEVEELVGDVAPLNNPDGNLNTGDLVLLERAIHGLVTLPEVILPSEPVPFDIDTVDFSVPLPVATYSVTDSVAVPVNETLTIQAGKIFKFVGNYYFTFN